MLSDDPTGLCEPRAYGPPWLWRLGLLGGAVGDYGTTAKSRSAAGGSAARSCMRYSTYAKVGVEGSAYRNRDGTVTEP